MPVIIDNTHGGTDRLDEINLSFGNPNYWSIDANLPIDLVQEKLAELGYQIAGPDFEAVSHNPVVLRGTSPRFTLEIVPDVRVTVSVASVQMILRRLDSPFDVYRIVPTEPAKKHKWR